MRTFPPPPTRWSRAALAALLGVGLAAMPGAAGSAAVSDTAREPVHVGTFESGLEGFAGLSGTAVWRTAAGVGRSGSRAMAARPLSTGPATARTLPEVGAPGATYDLRVWVRATAATTAVLRLRASRGRIVDVATSRQPVGPGGWTVLDTQITLDPAGADLSLRIGATRLLPDQRLLVDDLRMWRTDPATVRAGDPLTNGCTYDARGIPSCGVYVGATHGSNSDPTALETDLGRRLSVRRTYYAGTGVASAVRTAQTDVAADRIPWISFKLPYSWADMAAGAGDAWARDLATRMAAVDGPVWLAFHHEPEGDGDIQAWRLMQERLAPIVHEAAPNVAFTVIVTGWHQFYGDSQYSLSQIWPRGVDVDIAGFDIYQQYGVVRDGTRTTRWTDMSAYFGKIRTWADQQGVEWGLAETGITNDAAEVDPDEIPDTVDLIEHYGGIAYTYFDTTLNSIAPWNLGTTAKREQFGRALESSPAIAD